MRPAPLGSRHAMARRLGLVGCLLLAPNPTHAQSGTGPPDIWPAREATIGADPNQPPIRIGLWDSGIDTTLFREQLARDPGGRPLVRGYDAFKRRADTPLEQLPASLRARREELDALTLALDDLDTGVDSPGARAVAARMESAAPAELQALEGDLGRWAGYIHGTALADALLAGHGRAELVVARMEWWHGDPPEPCWTRELAHREAASIGDLLQFLVASGARVVNMSWGRHERSYIANLRSCAPAMPAEERQALARYTVDTIRAVLRHGMEQAPHVLFVGAAGNEGQSVAASNPATRLDLANFMLVGAVDRAGALADFSNTGPEVSIYANGWRVPGRLPGGTAAVSSGTSIAAPLVSNAAAKVLAINPNLTGAQVRQILEQTADPNATGQLLLHPARAVERTRRGSP